LAIEEKIFGPDHPTVAGDLSNLARLLRQANHMEEARKENEKALKIYRGLAQKDPAAYLPYVARTLNNLGNVDSDQHRNDQARQKYEEALKIYEDFAQQDPQRFSPDVERLKQLLAELPNTQGP
jgi:nephrocystin-3